MKKIAAPDDVEPVTVGKTRYEAPHWGKTLGFAQNGGHVSAVDIATGKRLWTVELYKIDYQPNMEADKQDIFIIEMKPSSDGRTLLVSDDRRRRWKVDLASHAAAPDTTP